MKNILLFLFRTVANVIIKLANKVAVLVFNNPPDFSVLFFFLIKNMFYYDIKVFKLNFSMASPFTLCIVKIKGGIFFIN